MEKKEKQFYETPSIMIIEVAQGGVVCASGTGTNGSPTFNGFDNEEEW